ncbi:uncharacterized protein [Battus philenor]|uniref:uncharacterized protein isoform X2 n=1 Tax=Battus philenor TaxID=42288 RepID=UPI0035CFE922
MIHEYAKKFSLLEINAAEALLDLHRGVNLQENRCDRAHLTLIEALHTFYAALSVLELRSNSQFLASIARPSTNGESAAGTNNGTPPTPGTSEKSTSDESTASDGKNESDSQTHSALHKEFLEGLLAAQDLAVACPNCTVKFSLLNVNVLNDENVAIVSNRNDGLEKKLEIFDDQLSPPARPSTAETPSHSRDTLKRKRTPSLPQNHLDTPKKANDSSAKYAKKKPLKIKNEADLDGGMVPIGEGNASVPSSLLEYMDWSSYTSATRKLLSAVFTRSVLATHSLTGKPSPAFPNKPAKKRLNPAIINDIVQTVVDRCSVSESLVRTSITTKCADESKMWRGRMDKNIKKQKDQENISPIGSESFDSDDAL